MFYLFVKTRKHRFRQEKPLGFWNIFLENPNEIFVSSLNNKWTSNMTCHVYMMYCVPEYTCTEEDLYPDTHCRSKGCMQVYSRSLNKRYFYFVLLELFFRFFFPCNFTFFAGSFFSVFSCIFFLVCFFILFLLSFKIMMHSL